jgi:hypothetical protein
MFRNRSLGVVAALSIAGSLLASAPVLAGNSASWQLGEVPRDPAPAECRPDNRCIADPRVPGSRRSGAAADAAREVLDFENSLVPRAHRARVAVMLDFLNTSWTAAGRTVYPTKPDPSRLINALNDLWSPS